MFLLVLIFAVGCTGESGYKPVDFSRRVEYDSPVRDQEKMPMLRVAVAAGTGLWTRGDRPDMKHRITP